MNNLPTVQEMIDAVQRSDDTPVIIEETGEQEGQVLLFIGAVDGVGSKTTATYAAQIIAEELQGKRVLHMDMNITSPGLEYFYFPDPSRIQLNLDRLYQEVKKGTVTGQQIQNHALASKRNPNIYLIPGTRNHLVADEFDDRVLQAIIKAARQHFDYVILNCSADLDNPGTVACLLEADHILFCTSGDAAEIRILNERLSQLFRPQMPNLVEKMKIILVERDMKFNQAEKYVKTTDLPYLGKIPYLQGLLQFKNQGGILRGKEANEYLSQLKKVLIKTELIKEKVMQSKEHNGWILKFKTLWGKEV